MAGVLAVWFKSPANWGGGQRSRDGGAALFGGRVAQPRSGCGSAGWRESGAALEGGRVGQRWREGAWPTLAQGAAALEGGREGGAALEVGWADCPLGSAGGGWGCRLGAQWAAGSCIAFERSMLPLDAQCICLLRAAPFAPGAPVGLNCARGGPPPEAGPRSRSTCTAPADVPQLQVDCPAPEQ
jgi:hypothetical protein